MGATMISSLLAMLITIAGASSPAPVVQASQPSDDEKPCLVIWRYGGYPPPLPPGASPQRLFNAGLEVAVWRDGAILLSPCSDSLGEHMLVGKVDPNEVAAALKSIREAGFAELSRDWVVPDSSYTCIAAADVKASTHSWHENLLPGFGGDLNTDKEYRAFIRTWKRTRAAIESLTPVELQRLGEEPFRGYDAKAPEKTAWRSR